MDGMEEKLATMLSDPEAMERFRQLASALSGSMGTAGGGDSGTLFGGGAGNPMLPPMDSGMAELLGRLLQAYGTQSETMQLVASLKPWLQPQRAERLEKAMRIAHLAKAAQTVLPTLLPGKG